MSKNVTEMVFILDKSGSMYGREADTFGGFNAMIDKQREEEGEAIVSTILFCDESQVIHDRVPVREVGKMTDKEYRPGGCTALLDAIGDAVRHIRNVHTYAREEDRPDKTIFVITTDGLENASRRYSYEDVKKLIEERQEKDGWEFLFLAANIDAVGIAARVGIREDRAVDFVCDATGLETNYSCVGEAISSYRNAGAVPRSWSKKIKEDYRKRK